MFHTASYFPLKQAGDFSSWNYIKYVWGVWAHVSVALGVCLCVSLYVFLCYSYCICIERVCIHVSMTVYLKDKLFRCWKIKGLLSFFFRLCTKLFLVYCLCVMWHWHIDMSSESSENGSQRGRDEMERRDKREREGEIENTLEKFAKRYHKWHRQFL